MNSLFAEALRLMRPFPFRTATVDLLRVRFDFEELLFRLDDERLEECETDDRE